MNEKIEIGDYRLFPKGEMLFSIALQENISFEKDIVIEVEHSIIGSDKFFFGKIKILFGVGTQLPGISDKTNGGVTFDVTKTTLFKMPKETFFEYKHEK